MPVPQRVLNAALRAAFSSSGLLAGLLLAAALPGCTDASLADAEPSPIGKLGAPRSIGAVQGRAARSPYEGQMVSLQGVITGNFVNGLNGFFLQDASGAEDGDPRTSDAIWVDYKRGRLPKLRRGDRVQVLGKVAELGDGEHSLTALTGVQVEVIGRGAVSITDLAAAPAQLQDYEALEGMWLRLTAPMTLTSNHNLLRYGELQLAFGGDLRAPTDAHAPGPKARTLAEANAQRRLLLDDGRSAENPDKLWFLPEPLAPERPLRAGSVLRDVEGVLDQRWGSWRLQITEKLAHIEQAPRPLPPELQPGLRLGSFNVHNLFNGNGRGGGFPTERGASTRAEYERQLAKVVAMLAALQPDIAALSEVENDGFDKHSALTALVDALNRALGEAGDYQAVVGGTAGDGPIRVAILYRRSRAEPEGPAVSPDPALFADARPPLAQSFRVADGARRITVVANHLKSKSGCPADPASAPGNADQGDGQGCWNAARSEQARALDQWLKSDPTGVATPHRVLLGDFNAYSREDPMRLLRSLGWREAKVKRDDQDSDYSYRFNGERGSLDHALLSPSLTAALLDAAHWSINSDESEAFDYNSERRARDWYRPDAYAASDHNPLLIVLDPLRATQ